MEQCGDTKLQDDTVSPYAKTDPPPPPVAVEMDHGRFNSQRPSAADAVYQALSDVNAALRDIKATLDSVVRNQTAQGSAIVHLRDAVQRSWMTIGSGNGMRGLTVLHVEDYAELRVATDRCLIDAGAAVLSASTISEAQMQLQRLGDGALHAALVDDRLPDGYGASLARELRIKYPDVQIVLTTGYPDAVVRPGDADVMLIKPVSFDRIRKALIGSSE